MGILLFVMVATAFLIGWSAYDYFWLLNWPRPFILAYLFICIIVSYAIIVYLHVETELFD
jgi:hypothetical protein